MTLQDLRRIPDEDLAEDNSNILMDAVLRDVAGESVGPLFAKTADGGFTCIADIEDLDTMAFKESDDGDDESHSDFDGSLSDESVESEEAIMLPSKGKGKAVAPRTWRIPNAKHKTAETDRSDLGLKPIPRTQKWRKLIEKPEVNEG
jgi:hypothetical protein